MRISALMMKATLVMGAMSVAAKEPSNPCHPKSRQMALIKNCFTGDMSDPSPTATVSFFQSSEPDGRGVAYCYNTLVLTQHKAGEAEIHVQALRDGKDNLAHVFSYTLAPNQVQAKNDTPAWISLKGLKGECYSTKGDREACAGGILKAIGWQDTDVPLVISLVKKGKQYGIAGLAPTRRDLKPVDLNGKSEPIGTHFTQQLVDQVRQKLVQAASGKMALLHANKTSPESLAKSSEQFRYCSMALDGFLKVSQWPDPFSPQEKMTLATLTTYMNNDAAPEVTPARQPAANAKPAPSKSHP